MINGCCMMAPGSWDPLRFWPTGPAAPAEIHSYPGGWCDAPWCTYTHQLLKLQIALHSWLLLVAILQLSRSYNRCDGSCQRWVYRSSFVCDTSKLSRWTQHEMLLHQFTHPSPSVSISDISYQLTRPILNHRSLVHDISLPSPILNQFTHPWPDINQLISGGLAGGEPQRTIRRSRCALLLICPVAEWSG